MASQFHSVHSHIAHSEHNISSPRPVTCNQQMYPGKLATHLQTRHLLVTCVPALLLGTTTSHGADLLSLRVHLPSPNLLSAEHPVLTRCPVFSGNPFMSTFFLREKHSQDMAFEVCVVIPIPMYNLSTSAPTTRPLSTSLPCGQQSWVWERGTAVSGEAGREGGRRLPQASKTRCAVLWA